MKRKTLRSRFIGYIFIAVLFTAILAVVSFFVVNDMSGKLGDEGGTILRGYVIFMIIFWIVFFVDAVFVERNMRKMEAPIKMVSEQALRMSQGQTITRSIHKENDELGDLTYSINALLEYILSRVEILQTINKGDYSFDIEPLGDDDMLTEAIINVVNTNNEILFEIKNAVYGINEIMATIADGAQSLAGSSTEQAATIEQFSAVIAEVQSMAEQTAEIAQTTLSGALESKHLMEGSADDIGRMTAAMDAIIESSHRIETIIKVIDGIAFQTNILALNAAIEAARAGVHGKGFAVVANEVRELASKSAEAARETSELIQLSIQSVNDGNAIVRQTAESISSLWGNASSTAEKMDLLAESAEFQRQSISEINRGISQFSAIVQSNSAMARENSASAQKMSAQSKILQQLVARFRLRADR